MPPRQVAARGGGLDRKVGPLPLKIWLLLAALLVVGYLVLRHPSASGAASNASDSASQLPGSTSDSTGAAGSPSDAATADLLAALGNDNQLLLQGLLAQSQIFYGGGAQFVPHSGTGDQDSGPSQTTQVAELTGLSSSSNGVPLNQAGYPENSSYTSLGLPAPTDPISGPNYGSSPTDFTVFGPGYQGGPTQPPVTSGTPTPGHNVAA